MCCDASYLIYGFCLFSSDSVYCNVMGCLLIKQMEQNIVCFNPSTALFIVYTGYEYILFDFVPSIVCHICQFSSDGI